MHLKRRVVQFSSLALLCMVCKVPVKAQKIDQDIDLANTLKKKYGDKMNVACLKSTTTITFKYTENKIAEFPVTASESVDESLIALKDNYTFMQELEYDDHSLVSDIKAYGKNNRPTDVYSQDVSIGSENIFYSGDHSKQFAIPFESFGQKQRYTATRYYDDLKYFNSILFPEYYPYVEKDIVFDVPGWLNIEFKPENFDGYDITSTVTDDPKTHDKIYTFTAKNLSQFHDNENHTPNMYSMLPHILILAKSYTTPGGQTVNIISSMDDLYKLLEGLVKSAGNNDNDVKALVTKLTQDKKTDIDKIKAIYYWVQDNVRYIAFENGISGLKPTPCQDVFRDKYGDCKGMANLLTVMLKDAGFDARRTWIGVEGIPYDFSTPALCIFNHAICTLFYNGTRYYLDGVEKYALFGENSDWIQGRPVLIEDGDKYIEDKVPVSSVDQSKIDFSADISVSPDNSLLVGKETDVYTGDTKTEILEGYNMAPTSERSADLKDYARDNDKNMEVSDLNTSDLENREIPLNMTYNFKVKDQVSVFDNDMYVNIDDKKWFQSLTFDSTRYNDYSFRFRRNYEQSVTFNVPAGYSVKHLPDNVDVENSNYSFKVNIKQNGSKITYEKHLVISNPIIKKKDFNEWNADIAKLKKTYDDQLVLEKK